MKTKKPVLLMNGHTDEIYTPKEAIYPLLPYIRGDWTRIWECAWGTGALAEHFKSEGFDVLGKDKDFLESDIDCDIIITNPPYSKKDKFLERAFELGKPFAFLLPLTALEGKRRGRLYRKYGIQLIIPNKRINFVTPNHPSTSWFQVAWFTWRLSLPKDLMFVDVEELKKELGIQ